MMAKHDKLIRAVGDLLIVVTAGLVALGDAYPKMAWIAAAVACLKLLQKYFLPAPSQKMFPVVLLILTLSGSTSCGHTPPTVSGVISCGSEAIQRCAPTALPAVNDCLAGDGDVVACLVGLIQPVGCMTQETIACVVRKEGSSANAAAQANPSDTVDAKRASRAKEYLTRQNIRFAD
jgi:hypothetical protein